MGRGFKGRTGTSTVPAGRVAAPAFPPGVICFRCKKPVYSNQSPRTGPRPRTWRHEDCSDLPPPNSWEVADAHADPDRAGSVDPDAQTRATALVEGLIDGTVVAVPRPAPEGGPEVLNGVRAQTYDFVSAAEVGRESRETDVVK
jgi:hypothetical protein